MWDSGPDRARVYLCKKIFRGARIVDISRIGDFLIDHKAHLALRNYVPILRITLQEDYLTKSTSLRKDEISSPRDIAR